MAILSTSAIHIDTTHAARNTNSSPSVDQNQAAIFNAALPNQQYAKERKQYQQALALLNKGKRTQHRKIANKLKDYPLYTYLRYYELKKYLSSSKEKEFAQFFEENSDSPTSWWLRNSWLNKLAETQQWKTFAKYYLPNKKTEHDCYYYWSQYKLNHQEKAFEGAKKLWLVGKSQPDACDPLFRAWKKSKHYKEQYTWDRIGLSIKKGKASLARYLAKSLSKKDQQLVDLWLKVRKNARTLKNTKQFKDTPKHRQIVMYGLGRIALFDLDLALSLWDQYTLRFNFTEEEMAAPRSYIARLLAFGFHAEASLWLEQANIERQDYELHQRQIRTALREEDWNSVYRWIVLLPEDKQTKSSWQYWKARAIQEISHQRGAALIKQQHFPGGMASRVQSANNVLATHINFTLNFTSNLPVDQLIPPSMDPTFIQRGNLEAKKIFQEVSKERSFYGFLASQYLARPINLNLDTIDVTTKNVKQLLSHRGVMRARELLLVNADLNAKREWVFTIKQLSRSERAVAAKLAAHWNWPFYAIYTASRSDNTNDIDLRFPRIYHNSVAKNARKNKIATEWIFSVIRQESAFREDAKSPVGAMGVMQIMPATAKYVSKKIGVRYKGSRELLNPEHNIKLGSSYLKQLLDRFDGSIIMASAAYNAGPHRARQWRPKDKPLSGDIWVETIPIKETREYVKNIVAFKAIYQYQLGYPPKLTPSMEAVPPSE